MHDSIQIEEIAATWLARQDWEGWGVADQAALTTWLEASTAHRVAYIRLEAAWQHARRLKAFAVGVLDCTGNKPEAKLVLVSRIAE
jgi:transmembrane sensor